MKKLSNLFTIAFFFLALLSACGTGENSNNNSNSGNSASDTIPPLVTSINPVNNATDVAINSAITATFTEAMDVSSITTLTFIVNDGSNNISGTVSYVGTTATFTPSAP
ncbi:MAG: Ig-like domain-containing protein, partial [Nitrospirota bacterium]